MLYNKDDENYYLECDGRYNCCYKLHFFFYFSGIVIIIVSDYLIVYNKGFVMATMLILNLFTGGYGSILCIEVFVFPDENGIRKKSSSKYGTVLAIAIFSILIHYNAVYFTFFHDVEHKVLIYLFLPLYLLLYLIMAYYFL